MEPNKCVDATTAKCNLVDNLLKKEESLDYGIECLDEAYMHKVYRSSAYLWIQTSGCTIDKDVCCVLEDYNATLNLNTWECKTDKAYICDTVTDCSVKTLEEIVDESCNLPKTNITDLSTGKKATSPTDATESQTSGAQAPPEPIVQYINVPTGVQSLTRVISLTADEVYTITTGFTTVLNVFVNDSNGENINSGLDIRYYGNEVRFLSGQTLTNITVYILGIYT